MGQKLEVELECPYVERDMKKQEESVDRNFIMKKFHDGYTQSVYDAMSLGVIVKI